MPNQVRVGVGTTGIPKAASELDQLRDKFRTTAHDIKKAGDEGGFAIGAAAGVAAKGVDLIGQAAYGAGAAIGSFIHSSISAASDLNETISKSKVVFGDSASGIEAWGKTAASSLGLSENAAIGAASSIGNLLLSTGTAQEKIAPMSKGIVQLAADLASFNNIPVEDALAKLQSGLVGQERPLRELGVAISAASVDTEAAALGFKKLNGEFTEGEKVQARYSLIFKQTSTAQGDFARTSDQLANSQRIANATMEDMSATLGTKMLPAQLAVTHAQIDFFEGLNLVADGISGKVTPATLQLLEAQVGQAKATDVVRESIGKLDQETRDAAISMGLLTQADIDATVGISTAARAQSDAAIVFAKSAQGMQDDARESGHFISHSSASVVQSEGDIAKAAAAAAAEVKKASDRMIGAALAVKNSLLTDAQDTVSGYFGVLITQDKLVETQAEITKNKRILASSTATKAERHDAQVALHQLGADQAQYLQDLAAAGASGSKLFTKNMATLLARLKNAHGAERREINAEILALEILAAKAYDAAQKVKTATNGGNLSSFGGGRAAGGPVSKGTPYIVGENHPEVFVPESNGYIIPTDPTRPTGGAPMGGSSGAMTFAPTVVIQGLATPSVREQIVRELGPLFAQWLRNNPGYAR